MEFLPRTLLYYMLSHGYLYSALLRHTKKRRLVLAAFPFFVAMGLFPYIHGLLPDGSMAQKIFARTGAVRQPLAFFCLLAALGKDLSALGGRLGRGRSARPGKPLSPAARRKLLLLLLVCAGLYAYGLHEAHDLKVRRLELPLSPKEGAERLRIVFAADLHIGPQTGTPFLRRTVDAINAQTPDIILLGGATSSMTPCRGHPLIGMPCGSSGPDSASLPCWAITMPSAAMTAHWPLWKVAASVCWLTSCCRWAPSPCSA
ncbi:hypothetical protein [uncultured Desulfovibrio sp.]|uniref:hypothetical protein n=1 Tax=uncultured Desulfovibrio sp. TaxID=167968 RepID=UPI002614883E|nr:hypothetical protein [uncultured Desulfovibrio sp.]